MWASRLVKGEACGRAASKLESSACCWTHRSFSKKSRPAPSSLSLQKAAAARAALQRRPPLPSPVVAPSKNAPLTPSPTANLDPRIQARPPGEKEVETKFPLPDVEKEKELGALQSQIADLYKSSQYRQALTLSRQLLETTQSHFGSDHPATASAHNNLGLLHKHMGEFDESRTEYKSALKVYKRVVGSDHASYAAALHNLGTCARTQLHVDSSLRATDRLSLLQESAESLEKAYSIRLQELGQDHPHTVASLSSWGATLASEVLSHYKKSQDKWVSTVSSSASEQGWQAAEQHLRTALETAIDKPRGPSLPKSKKPKQRKFDAMDAVAKSITTLSGASAGQNLAVFLKARTVTENPPNPSRLAEALELYEQVLQVRTELLPAGHADLVATQHSLAELVEASGDPDRANEIRQSILDAYEPDSEEGAGGGGGGGGRASNGPDAQLEGTESRSVP